MEKISTFITHHFYQVLLIGVFYLWYILLLYLWRQDYKKIFPDDEDFGSSSEEDPLILKKRSALRAVKSLMIVTLISTLFFSF